MFMQMEFLGGLCHIQRLEKEIMPLLRQNSPRLCSYYCAHIMQLWDSGFWDQSALGSSGRSGLKTLTADLDITATLGHET